MLKKKRQQKKEESKRFDGNVPLKPEEHPSEEGESKNKKLSDYAGG